MSLADTMKYFGLLFIVLIQNQSWVSTVGVKLPTLNVVSVSSLLEPVFSAMCYSSVIKVADVCFCFTVVGHLGCS